MKIVMPKASALLPLCCILSACGGSTQDEQPVNIDYSNLSVAKPQDSPLFKAVDDQLLLAVLRNGVRMSLPTWNLQPIPGGIAAPTGSSAYSDTTVQVDGVDEGDLVKYDGRNIYALRPDFTRPFDAPASPGSTSVIQPGYPSKLAIIRTDAATAGTETLAEFPIDGHRAVWSPGVSMYRVTDAGQTTRSLAVVSQVSTVMIQIDQPFPLGPVGPASGNRIAVDLLDVQDPLNVSQSWSLQIEGNLRASRQIGNMIYLVSSYRPRLDNLIFAAATVSDRQANERRIQFAGADELMPHYWDDAGSAHLLARPRDCLLSANLTSNQAYFEMVFVTVIDLSVKRVSDVACLSAGENGIYVSQESLYLGSGGVYPDGVYYSNSSRGPSTVLHKFALQGDALEYRATGSVAGELGWSNSSYFMDEYQGDLRIVTTSNFPGSTVNVNHISVLRESANHKLSLLATLPNAAHPDAIGKPGETVRAVRFSGERAYVVTFRTIDPLYVIDLHDPTDPMIAGALEVPGVSTYLNPLGTGYLLGVGQQTDANGRPQGVKVELFDIRDIAHPQSVGANTFGRSWSDATFNFHALSFVTIPGTSPRYRIGVPLSVFDTPSAAYPGSFTWSYTGLHLFEVSGVDNGAAQLRFQGVLKAEEVSSQSPGPSPADPVRSVLHDDSVFYIFGDKIISSLWQNIPTNQ